MSKYKCSGVIVWGFSNTYQCSRKGSVEFNGKHYCKQHAIAKGWCPFDELVDREKTIWIYSDSVYLVDIARYGKYFWVFDAKSLTSDNPMYWPHKLCTLSELKPYFGTWISPSEVQEQLDKMAKRYLAMSNGYRAMHDKVLSAAKEILKLEDTDEQR